MSAVIIATVIASAVASSVSVFLVYCLDYANRDEQQREYEALHDQVATLELRVRAMEGGR